MRADDSPFTSQFLKRLQRLKIHTRRAFLGSRQGVHISRRRGHGLEFSDFRPYTLGDDFRHIDWGVYGRTDRLYVREFREEQNLNVLFLLDTSGSMAFPIEEHKFERARDLALALGFVALSNGDQVTFNALGQSLSRRYSGPQSFSQAMKALQEVAPAGPSEFMKDLYRALSSIRIPGKCFFISDFLFELDHQINLLDLIRSRNFEIVVIQILSPVELDLSLPLGQIKAIDYETKQNVELSLQSASKEEYQSLLRAHRHSLEEYCFRGDIPYLLVSTKEDTAEIVLNRFPALGLLT